MNAPHPVHTVDGLKKQARALKKATPGLLHTHALELVARQHGYRTYAAAKQALEQPGGAACSR